jgi:hypothetical protein
MNKEITIDTKKIPIPKRPAPPNRWEGNLSTVRATLRRLRIGDSVNTSQFAEPHQKRYYYQTASRLGISIVIRAEGKHLRIWRMK